MRRLTPGRREPLNPLLHRGDTAGMLACSALTTSVWSPDLSSSGRDQPRWTRIACDGTELINGLESVAWDAPNIQVQVCEECGTPDCEIGGYVRVTRLADIVLWSAPRPDLEHDWGQEVAVTQFTPSVAVQRHGGVIISGDAWEQLRRASQSVPALGDLPPSTRADVEQVWLAEARRGQVFDPASRQELRRQLIAAHPIDLEAAATYVERLAGWFRAEPDAVIDGAFTPVRPDDPALVTLYLDQPEREWTALFVSDEQASPAFAGAWTLTPPPSLPEPAERD
jgi:hypothetical protein